MKSCRIRYLMTSETILPCGLMVSVKAAKTPKSSMVKCIISVGPVMRDSFCGRPSRNWTPLAPAIATRTRTVTRSEDAATTPTEEQP